MAEYFAGGHLRFLDGEWRDDNGDVVNVKEVRHGKWNTMAHRFYSTSSGKSGNVVFCSKCGEPSASGFKTPYCALCGAKMNTL